MICKVAQCGCSPHGTTRPVVSVTSNGSDVSAMVYCENCGMHTRRVHAATEAQAKQKAKAAWEKGEVASDGSDAPSIKSKTSDWVGKGRFNNGRFGKRIEA